MAGPQIALDVINDDDDDDDDNEIRPVYEARTYHIKTELGALYEIQI